MQSDIIIVFGGDGSFLKVCQTIITPTPVFMVAAGEKNRLATINKDQAKKKIGEILKGKFRTEPRSRIQTNIPKAPLALNEVVIAPEHSVTTLHYELSVENGPSWQDYGDGILICTPTGSNAYFLAAGGFEIPHSAPFFGLAPLYSIENNKPKIADNTKTIQITNLSSRDKIQAVFDGQQRFKLKDSIEIRLSGKPIFIGYPLLPKKTEKIAPNKNWTPATRLVFELLQKNESATQAGLAEESGLSGKSVRRSLNTLLIQKQVEKTFSKDRRNKSYRLI